eukprot:1158694-Pelagomonas_calceolata.AAC.3
MGQRLSCGCTHDLPGTGCQAVDAHMTCQAQDARLHRMPGCGCTHDLLGTGCQAVDAHMTCQAHDLPGTHNLTNESMDCFPDHLIVGVKD